MCDSYSPARWLMEGVPPSSRSKQMWRTLPSGRPAASCARPAFQFTRRGRGAASRFTRPSCAPRTMARGSDASRAAAAASRSMTQRTRSTTRPTLWTTSFAAHNSQTLPLTPNSMACSSACELPAFPTHITATTTARRYNHYPRRRPPTTHHGRGPRPQTMPWPHHRAQHQACFFAVDHVLGPCHGHTTAHSTRRVCLCICVFASPPTTSQVQLPPPPPATGHQHQRH